MEKRSRKLLMKQKGEKLPTISPNKSTAQLHIKLPQLSHSPVHQLGQLNKLYHQYKSNANILKNSPYYTNRQHQQKIITYINANKCKPTPEQLYHIEQKYALNQLSHSQNHQKIPERVNVQLHCLKIVMEVELWVRTVEQLEVLLKKEYALQEIKSYGEVRKVDSIGGFVSAKKNAKLDYLLSHKEESLPTGTYELEPWFFQRITGKSIELKHFHFVRCLGSGGFSLVYLVRDKIKGNYHALKLIDKSFILQSDRDMIIENQRYVLGQLKDSPFITPLRFGFETKNFFAFAIEYCPGGQLFYQLKKVKRMTEEQARFYFLEILMGLDNIHQHGIIYRDLKPENLLIGADGHIRIADFGLAKPLLGRASAHSFCGSPQYMAPEMLLKSGHTYTLDYYCLGALLYELVVGIPPYYSLNQQQIYQSVLYQQLSFPPNTTLSSELKNLLMSLLQKNPSKRLGCLHGVKEIMIHPWVGRITRKQIESKQLKPPFLPDLSAFNFDESELQQRNKQISKKISDDMRSPAFETHFNQQFYFADPSYLPQKSLSKSKSKKGHAVKSLERRKNSQMSIRRAASDRGQSY